VVGRRRSSLAAFPEYREKAAGRDIPVLVLEPTDKG
jgi:hypothetical protein